MDVRADYLLAGGAVGALLLYYLARVKRVQSMRAIPPDVRKDARHDTYSSKFPFTNMKMRMNDPSVWKVNEPGMAREGLYGLERRDYLDPVGGTRVVTYTDAYVNV